MNPVRYLIVHCSDSPFGCADVVRRWHTDPSPEGNGWRAIGYHTIILNGLPWNHDTYLPEFDGAVEPGRPFGSDRYLAPAEQGAHVEGLNHCSLGVCLIGHSGGFTPDQYKALKGLLRTWLRRYNLPVTAVLGHGEAQGLVGPVTKPHDPGLDMNQLRGELHNELTAGA
jgi:hypothetical protein